MSLLLIAHRGDIIHHQENTLEAFQSAFEKGADGVEMDIHFYDGEIIVVHNYLFDQNKSHLRLDQVLEKINSKGRIEIEIKALSTDILKPLQQILNRFSNLDLELTTSEIPLSIYIKQAFPKTPFGLILHDFFFQDWMNRSIVEQKLTGWGKMSKSDRLHISFKVLNQFGKGNLVKKLHQAGFVVHSHIYNTGDQNSHLSALMGWKVDQCTFDDIRLLYKRQKK